MRRYTLGDMSRVLGRTAAVLHGYQMRFGLPLMTETGYSPAYLAFLRKIVYLRLLGISEEQLLRLWHLEKKLLYLLHADVAGSPTWFLDSCGSVRYRKRRLLLSNYDMGGDLSEGKIQLGLQFRTHLSELFGGQEMGEDAHNVLESYLKQFRHIRQDIAKEARRLQAAAAWARRLP